MNILYVPFASMRSYKDGRFLLKRDSNATKAKNLIRQLIKCGHTFTIIVPGYNDLIGSNRFAKTLDYFAPFSPDKLEVSIVECDNWGWNAASARMNFDTHFYKRMITSYNYDLIIYDCIETARNIRFFTDKPIITMLTHTPVFEKLYEECTDKDYLYFKILDGLYASNVILVNTRQAAENVNALITWHNLPPINANKFHLYDYYFSMEEITNTDKRKEQFILLMTRLSDPKRTHTDKLLKFLAPLNVHYTNPTEMKFKVPEKWTHEKQKTRQDFIDILNRAKVVIVPYDTEISYSTSYWEAMAAGCRIITFKHNLYPELNQYDTIIPEDFTKNELINAISIANSDEGYAHIALKYSVENKYNGFNTIINKLYGG